MRTAVIVSLVVVAGGYIVTDLVLERLGYTSLLNIGILVAIGLATWRLSATGASWPAVGLRKPNGWGWVALSVIALYAITMIGVGLIVTPLANALGLPSLDLARFNGLAGNTPAYARLMIVVWTSVAFGEEMLFRGFLLSQLQKLLGSGRIATASAVILQAIVFGSGHLPLGVRGVMTAGLIGLIFGTWYVLRGRNLWPLIFAHGLTDSVSVTAIYLGAVPG